MKIGKKFSAIKIPCFFHRKKSYDSAFYIKQQQVNAFRRREKLSHENRTKENHNKVSSEIFGFFFTLSAFSLFSSFSLRQQMGKRALCCSCYTFVLLLRMQLNNWAGASVEKKEKKWIAMVVKSSGKIEIVNKIKFFMIKVNYRRELCWIFSKQF